MVAPLLPPLSLRTGRGHFSVYKSYRRPVIGVTSLGCTESRCPAGNTREQNSSAGTASRKITSRRFGQTLFMRTRAFCVPYVPSRSPAFTRSRHSAIVRMLLAELVMQSILHTSKPWSRRGAKSGEQTNLPKRANIVALDRIVVYSHQHDPPRADHRSRSDSHPRP